jgi:hypothetical protein
MRLYLMLTWSVVIFLIVTVALTGCAGDPLGATTRTDIRARAAVDIAEAQRDAQIGVADAQAAGAIGVARAWSSILPTIVFLIGLTAVVLLVINWRGRLAMERERRRPASLPGTGRTRLPDLQRLQLEAKRQGMTVTVVDGMAYLVDAGGRVVGRRQLSG